jgi:hypothetical protein
MDVELQSGQEILTCPSEDCRKPFQVELPTARPTPALIVPGQLDDGREAEPGAPPPVAHTAAAAETELVQVKPVMFRRYPLRYLGYALLTVAGAVLLIYALLDHRPVLGLLAVAAAVFGGARLLLWWLRVNSTTLTVTTKRSVLRTGVLSPQSVEIPHAAVSDVQVRQNFVNRLLDVGDLSVSGNGGERKAFVVMAVPKVEAIVGHIRNHRPA